MDLKQLNIDLGKELEVDLKNWSIDYALLRELSATRRRTVATADEVWQLCQDVALAVGVPAEAIGAILYYEFRFPERAVYRAAATRDDGSTDYRGITQASRGFWTDVIVRARLKGWVIAATVPENASLFEQIAAPFIYLDRYRKSVKNHLFTPAMIYALHQQGPGAAEGKFASVSGSQSATSLRAIQVARLGARGKRSSLYL